MLYILFIFEVTSDSKLYALWCPKGAQKEVFGEPFRNDFEVSGKSENEAPAQTCSTVFEVLGRQKSDGFRRYFRKGSEGAQEWFFLRF